MVCFPNKFGVVSWPSVTLCLIFLVTVALVVWSYKTSPDIIVLPTQTQKASEPVVKVNVRGSDSRYTRAPEPERDWYTSPDLSRIPNPATPFNIPTQGVAEEYQSMGIVKTPEGKLLPLFGRRCVSSRERYNYYTRTDSYNPLPLPIEMQGRDCQDQVGCPELFNGDRVKISTLNESGEVTIYKVRDIIR
jgi:hypothetical protein